MGIYIIGMHRSGTSALAGMVSALTGLPASRLAVSSNPLGQWERPELQPALELLLARNRTTWAHPPEPSESLRVGPILETYTGRVFRKNCAGPFLWKDPRLCLTIDHWLTLPQDKPKIIFIHRDPAAVAASLARRNNWPVDRGLALWERTNRNAISRLSNHPLYCLDHDLLMEDPASVAAGLQRWFGLVDDNQRSMLAADMIDPSLAATVSSTIQPTAAMLSLAERLHSVTGPGQLSLDGLPSETESNAAVLGRAGATELVRRVLRALQAMRLDPKPEVASAADRDGKQW